MLHPFPSSLSHSAFLMGVTCVSQPLLLPLGATSGLTWPFFPTQNHNNTKKSDMFKRP